jgi:NAD(P)-dependent dehydrogenase (short-subunit alcohol dehydrogenase family)
MLARKQARLDALAAEIPNAVAFACDVADQASLQETLTHIVLRFGTPSVVIHNAVGGSFGTFRDIDPKVLEYNFQVNVMALLHLARQLTPKMVEAGGGSLIVTGNTSALRGKANFAGFAPTKAAQRILAESMARDLGPQGMHVAYLMIDAVIDVPWTRSRFKDAPDDFFIKPAAIADEAWHLAHQDRSAWSFLSEIRPYREPW